MAMTQHKRSLVVKFINVSSTFYPSNIWYLCSLSYWLISTYKSRLKCSIITSHQVSWRAWVPGQLQQAWKNISEKCLLHTTQMPSVLFGMSVISFAIKKYFCMSLEDFEYFHTLASSTDLWMFLTRMKSLSDDIRNDHSFACVSFTAP